MRYDAVLSFHMNEFSCGVARFNKQLAQRLGVPCLPLDAKGCRYPLVSVKIGEMPECTRLTHAWEYDLLFHDRPQRAWPANARRIFYADEIGIPSILVGNPTRGVLNVLLFGMSNKLNSHTVYVERLRDLLAGHPDYTVSVSTAVHEGSPWDGAFTTTVETLRRVFGDHLRVLGYLADDALAKELRDCTAAALFFDPAARANNTSLWAALEAGCPVVTNLDDQSPPDLIHTQTVFDLKRLTEWPSWDLLDDVTRGGREAVKGRSWERLIAVLRA